MKKLSRGISLLLLLTLISLSFVACKKTDKSVDNDVYKDQQSNTVKDSNESETKTKEDDKKEEAKNEEEKKEKEVTKDITIKVATLKGPTGMGMAKLMEDVSAGTSPVKSEFILTGAPDELVGKVVNGEVDFACLPTNLASVLYNKTKGQIQLAAVNTLGVLYIMEVGNNINTVEDLKDKTIYTSGQGSVPEYVLQYILEKNGIEVEKDVTIDFTMQHAEVAATVISGDTKVALLPQPFVTTTTMKNKEARIALDMTKEWEKIQGEDSPLAMGCIIVNKDFAAENKELVDTFLDEYKKSVEWVNANKVEAGLLIEKQGILPSAKIAEMAIPNSNIVYIGAEEAKQTLNDFYQILFDFNPKSLGGKLPDGDFYYAK